jgi:hypothetical protein
VSEMGEQLDRRVGDAVEVIAQHAMAASASPE